MKWQKVKISSIFRLYRFRNSACCIRLGKIDNNRGYVKHLSKLGKQNLILNDIEGKQHKLIQADCLQWLEKCERQFDLIFVDPPTFSNSKRMEDSWDVQRDHIKLMRNLKRIYVLTAPSCSQTINVVLKWILRH